MGTIWASRTARSTQSQAPFNDHLALIRLQVRPRPGEGTTDCQEPAWGAEVDNKRALLGTEEELSREINSWSSIRRDRYIGDVIQGSGYDTNGNAIWGTMHHRVIYKHRNSMSCASYKNASPKIPPTQLRPWLKIVSLNLLVLTVIEQLRL